jgi:hypothetical protein
VQVQVKVLEQVQVQVKVQVLEQEQVQVKVQVLEQEQVQRLGVQTHISHLDFV